ncbi:WbqC family protein [Vibrio atlanticus]|nr:WbqC family protein [Vibrio atlanticus]
MIFSVMQPYIFPYLGYYQLVNAVDKFVFYDDVTFIKSGYINRNSILSNGLAQRFTIPVPGMSSNILINELKFDSNVKKILKAIQQSYSKAPFFNQVYPLVEGVLMCKNRSIEHICALSIKMVFEYLEIDKEILFSSNIQYDRTLPAPDKLIAIAKALGGDKYINTPGGKSLYSKDYFAGKNVHLSFIETEHYKYTQNNNEFIPHLSMIDVLMWNEKDAVKELLNKYRLD